MTGIPWLDNLITNVQKNPQVQNAENSPLGQFLQKATQTANANLNNRLATQNAFSQAEIKKQSGKQLSPQDQQAIQAGFKQGYAQVAAPIDEVAPNASFVPTSEFQDLPKEINTIPQTAGKGMESNAKGQVRWQTPGEPIPYTSQNVPATANPVTQPTNSGISINQQGQQQFAQDVLNPQPGEPGFGQQQVPPQMTQNQATTPIGGGEIPSNTQQPNTGGGLLKGILNTANSAIKVGVKTGTNILAYGELANLLTKGTGTNPISALDFLAHGGSGTKTTQQSTNTDQATSRYTTTDPIQSGMVTNPNDFGIQKAKLQQQIANESITNPIQAQADQGKLAGMQTQYDSQQSTRDLWTQKITPILSNGNTAYNDIQSAGSDLFNLLDKGYNALQSSGNPRYSSMATSLQNLSKITGTDYTQFKTKDALLAAVDKDVTIAKNNWELYLNNQYGTKQVPTGPAAGSPQGGINVQPAQQTGGIQQGAHFGSQL